MGGWRADCYGLRRPDIYPIQFERFSTKLANRCESFTYDLGCALLTQNNNSVLDRGYVCFGVLLSLLRARRACVSPHVCVCVCAGGICVCEPIIPNRSPYVARARASKSKTLSIKFAYNSIHIFVYTRTPQTQCIPCRAI